METLKANESTKLRTSLNVETVSTWESGCEAVRLWHERPNLVNRRLCGCSVFWEKTNYFKSKFIGNRDFLTKISGEVIEELLKKSIIIDCCEKEKENICHNLTEHLISCFEQFGSSSNEGDEDGVTIDFTLRKLLPRSLKKFNVIIELVVVIKKEIPGCKDFISWFIPLSQPKETEQDQDQLFSTDKILPPCLLGLSYGIRYRQLEEKRGSYSLLVMNTFQEGSSPPGMLCANLKWLKETLLPKMKNWSESFAVEKNKSAGKKLQSLSLVDVEEYSRVYNKLKEKYAQSLCEAWQENTDPQKFVFEDISIASYLVVLWEEEQRKNKLKDKQSFVDLGCGNGLLVYLLTKEGYKGKGVDIRRRNIWESFGKDTILMEQPLQPNNCKFDDADWLIGNHSDELTPWIPVIAARSSYKAKFFLLPCCFHDFTRKFQKNLHDSSQYQTYLDYVREIGEACGFVIEQDIQRIPSTKRTCHIGRKRTYEEANQSDIDIKVENFLNSRGCSLVVGKSLIEDPDIGSQNDKKNSTMSHTQFEPREAKEKVRNCTQIDKNIRDDIVQIVANELLRSEQKLGQYEDCLTSNGQPCSEWNCGGSVALENLASLLGAEKLQKLKSQCGGLQTLIRNHGYIFKVIQGQVRFKNYKDPADNQAQKKRKNVTNIKRNTFKMKLCWFHHNHPQGCLLSSMDCQFAHEENELRTAEKR